MLMKMKIKKVSEELTWQVDTLKSSLVNYNKKVYTKSVNKNTKLCFHPTTQLVHADQTPQDRR